MMVAQLKLRGFCRAGIAGILFTVTLFSLDTAIGQEAMSMPAGEGGELAARQLIADQCFRCHGDGMWRDLKTDRTGWVSVIYRMLGRGGVWTPEQINLMADYLASIYPAEAGR